MIPTLGPISLLGSLLCLAPPAETPSTTTPAQVTTESETPDPEAAPDADSATGSEPTVDTVSTATSEPEPLPDPEATTSPPSTSESTTDEPSETPPPKAEEPPATSPSERAQPPSVTTEDARPADDEGSEEKAEDDKKNKKNKKNKLEWSLGGRVMTGWEGEIRRPPPESGDREGFEHEFFLRQARVKFRLNYTKRFALRFSAELSDALRSPNFDRVSYLRNGYARIRFHDAARVHVGYFKRPFSRLELRSPGRLPFRGRGLANDRIIEDRNYGDRSVGGMLWGKIRPARMRYYVGTFAPALRTEGVDLVGRLRADPWEWASVGVSGGFKRVVNGVGESVNVGSANADVRFKVAGFYFLGDLVLGQDYLVPGEPWSLGLVGYARYDVDLPKKLVLQPVVLMEWADTNITVSQNDAIRSVVGVNLLWRKRFRVMPQVEFIRPRGVIDNPWTNKDTYYVMLSLEL